VSFEGFLAAHLTEIKARYKALADQLAASTSNAEIARLGKESASLSHIVELIDERIAVLQSVAELQQLEQDERAK
jgi:protein subunit release factor A